MSKTTEERLAVVETQVGAMEKALERIEDKQDQLIQQANRWRGGFMVILGIGGLIGWLADHAVKFLTRAS